MDAGMAAIADMKRDSSRRSRPPPAGQDFQFPAHPYAAMATPASPPPDRSKHFSMGPAPTSEPNSIAALMMSSDQQESSLPYAQPAAPALPANPANVPLPLSPPPIQRFHLTDQPFPPLPDSPHTLESAELAPPPSHVQRVPPRAFTPPGSTDFYVVPHQDHIEAYQDPSHRDGGAGGYAAGGPPNPSRFAQPAFEAPWVAPEEYEKWDGAYDVPRDVYGDAEQEDKKRFRKKLVWCILAIIVVVAAIVGIAVGISKSNSSSAKNNAADSETSATSDSGDQLSSSTMVIVESASKGASSSSTAEAIDTATSSLTRAIRSSTTETEPTVPSTTPATSIASTSTARVRSTSAVLDSTTELPSAISTSAPLTTTAPATSTAATRTTSSAVEPSVTCVTGGTTVLGYALGATTTVLPAGQSCPTSSASTRGSSRSSSSSDDDEDDGEDDDEDSTGAHSAVLRRHRRMRRAERSHRM